MTPDFDYQRLHSRTQARTAFDTACETARQRILIYEQNADFYGLGRLEFSERVDHFLKCNAEGQVEILLQQSVGFSVQCPRLMSLIMRHGDRLSIRQVGAKNARFDRGLSVFDSSVVLRRPSLLRMTTIWDTSAEAIAAAARIHAELAEHAGAPLSPIATGL